MLIHILISGVFNAVYVNRKIVTEKIGTQKILLQKNVTHELGREGGSKVPRQR